MTVKTVTVQLERLKLFTYQSQKKGPFPIPHYKPSSLEPVSLPTWDRDSRLPGPHSLAICCTRPRVRGLLHQLSLEHCPGKPQRADFVVFCHFFSFWGTQRNGRLGTYWQSPTSLKSQETWPLPSSLRNTRWFIFTHCRFGIHPFNQACQHYVFIWPMRSPHS